MSLSLSVPPLRGCDTLPRPQEWRESSGSAERRPRTPRPAAWARRDGLAASRNVGGQRFPLPADIAPAPRTVRGRNKAARDAGWLKAGWQRPALALKCGAPPSPFVPGSASPPRLAPARRSRTGNLWGREMLRVGVDSSAAERCGAAGAGRMLPHWFCQERRAIMERHLAVFANKHCLLSCLTPSATQPNFPAPIPSQKWQPETAPKSSC